MLVMMQIELSNYFILDLMIVPVKIKYENRNYRIRNTIYYEHLRTKGNPNASIEDRFTIFVAGDDLDAKTTISKLIEDIGFAPVDTGSLREGGRKQQPGSPIYNSPMTARAAHTRLNEL